MELLSLAELLAGLSMVADIGMGLEPGEAGRATLVAMELADAVGADSRSDVYYTTMPQHIGCTGYAHEAAALLGGDEIAVKRAAVHTDFARPRAVLLTYLPHLAPAASLITRVRAAGMPRSVHARSSGDTAARIARSRRGRRNASACHSRSERRCSTSTSSGTAKADRAQSRASRSRNRHGSRRSPSLPRCFTRWPAALPRATPCGASRLGSGPAARGALWRNPARFLGALDAPDPLAAAIAAEPEPRVRISELGLDRVCRAFGDAVDLKTPLHHGHSAGVSRLVEASARLLGLDQSQVNTLRWAGHVHDLGRAAVPNGVWERPGPLSWPEQEQVRLHAHYSERVLARCGPLSDLASLAGSHHERLDGSGYHRQLTASGLGMPARLLAASDAFQAMTQTRAHRPARSRELAAAQLAADAGAGRLDADAVRAVLEAAGGTAETVSAPRPAGLTERQVEVLVLLAEGLSNPQIAERLVISRRTAEHHVQDVYARIGVSSRAGAALFAMEHDLLRDG